MKVLVYLDKTVYVGGCDIAHTYHIKALKEAGVEVTTDPNDSYDIVDINLFFGGALKLAKKCHKAGIPLIMHGHSTYAEFRYGFLLWRPLSFLMLKCCLYRIYKLADHAIPVSNFAKHILQPYLVYYDTPMTVVPNAIDISEFEKNEAHIKAFEEKFGISKTDKIVVNAAGPSYRKGFIDFIKLAKRNPSVKFFWLGSKKGPIQLKIKRLFKHLPSNMIMPGYIRDEVFHGALERANCVLYPSFIETDGYTAIEAMAAKSPLLIRDIGSMEWLTDGVHCYKGNTVDELDDKLHYILEHDQSKVVEAAYEKVHERDLKTIGEKLKAVYEKVIIEKRKNK